MKILTPWQMFQVFMGFVFIAVVTLHLTGCTYVYVFDNDLGDVGIKGMDERVRDAESLVIGR